MAHRLALLVALVVGGGLGTACHHRPVVVTPEPPHLRRWILTPDADDDDQFCVVNDTGRPDALLLCASVGDIRRYVRLVRSAN